MNLNTDKKRLAISISMIWAIRNIIYSGLLEKLIAEFDVFIVLRKPAPEVEALCRTMGAHVWVAPEVNAAGAFAGLNQRIVDWLTQAHKLRHHLHSEEMKKTVTRRELSRIQKIYLKLRDWLLALAGKSSLYDLMIHLERWTYYRSHDLREMLSFLTSTQIELFLFTAPFQQDSNEIHLMRTCKIKNVKMVAMVLGFDNLTTKGRLPEFTDYYLVWNEIMKAEIPRIYPNIEPTQIFVTGSSQFDFYASQAWGYDREVFCRKIGLDAGKPIILYAANPEFLVPEEHYLVQDLAHRMLQDDELTDMQLVVRLHPFETSKARWDLIARMPNIVLSVPWKTEEKGSWGNIEAKDIHFLAGSLKHSFCNINVSSTMSLDAVFCDRPVICPAYAVNSDSKLSQYMRDLYDREHFVPITYSEAVELVTSPNALISAIKSAFHCPQKSQHQRAQLTQKMLGRPVGFAATEIKNVLSSL